MPFPRSPVRAGALAAALATLATACGDDGGSTASVDVGISSRDEWCAVVAEVDELFTTTDNSSEEFPVKQVGYEDIGRLLAQLEDGLDHVDASDRQAVATSIAWARSLTDVMTDATDEQEAGRLLEPIFASGEDGDAGAPWIRDNCGIDIDG